MSFYILMGFFGFACFQR